MPKKKPTEAQQARKFAWILPGILLAIAALFYWRGHTARAEVFAWIVLGVLFVSQILRPVWLRFFRLWMKFAEGLSWVMTRVILTVFFFLVVTPLGLIMRLFGKAPMDMAWRDGKASYWIDKPERESTLELARRQF